MCKVTEILYMPLYERRIQDKRKQTNSKKNKNNKNNKRGEGAKMVEDNDLLG